MREKNGRGIAYTGNFFYAYYRNLRNDPIPYASVYLNSENSQKIVGLISKSENNGERRTDREYVGWAYEFSRNTHGTKNAIFGNNQEPSVTRGNVELGGELLRVGKYYYKPELYCKVERTDSGSTGQDEVRHSLKELDTPYLEAVERGDMATAERLVREAATIAMPNTKVVDKDGLPKVVYHGTSSNDTFNVFDLEDSGMIFMTSSKGIADQYTQYYCHFLASAK